MGVGRSKPVSAEENNRAYTLFLEKFKNTHSYLSEQEIEQNAVMTWDTMSPEQKSQFLNLGEPARAYIKKEYLPTSTTKRNRTVSTGKARSKAKPKTKLKASAMSRKSTKVSKKSQKAISSNVKGKAEQRLGQGDRRQARREGMVPSIRRRERPTERTSFHE
ncbi:uncharacterized protein LOC111601929 [Drosophila hydei]|uniref:Uncharacterized protein LOC111601929 n=1 Tax=Drosophila hydei TaxID=7224 RepID=A0A6J1MC72_DROHY|nr:uncharacterized protein LOC111601929 [Drosophila hydei]